MTFQLVFLGMSSGCIAVYDVTTGELVQVLEGHAEAIISTTLNADNTVLVSTSTDRTVGVWQLAAVSSMGGRDKFVMVTCP